MTSREAGFIRAVLTPGAEVPAGLSDGQNRPAGRRFDVYRNNVAVSLTAALHEAFPVITKLLGKANMDGLAGLYLRAHPPSSPLMMYYGAHFPAFLAGMEQLSHIGYLADVARLELALRRAYHAADAQPMPPVALAELDPEALLAAHLRLAPAVQVVASPWPVLDIWRYNTEDGAAKPQPGAQDVLITRPGFDPVPQLLPPGGAAWVSSLMQGHSIGEAYEAAAARTPDFDLSTTLALLLQGSAITKISSEG